MTQTTYKKEFTLKAWLQLGGEPVVLSGTMAGEDTILEIEFKSLSLEKIINDLIQLVRPTYSLQLPFPWDRLLGFELKDLKLRYNINKKSIGFASDFNFGVPFLELERVYIDAKSVHDVMISFDGKILGKTYEGDDKLGWNLVGADGPPTPPPPPSLFELKFLGLGQHVSLIHAARYEHVSDAIADMASLFEPPKPGTLIPSFSKALAFDNNSNWLFGLDAEIMGTVALSIVFNDPNLYGLFISLKGEKAKSLAGLEFEILYKKITDDIGVYQIELKLPAYIRNMEFGQVSVTLPQIGVDIYTNGNFKIDFGFPRNLDFTNSFAVQVFPFVGFGGFYFAVLNGATSSTVPITQNGKFNPVLEFGIGLQLGIGKTIDKGILQASATLTYVGVVEGTLAWFSAKDYVDKSLPDFYYRLSGTFAIVGKIWGGVHFAIVSASLDLTVYASATVVIEACEPILLTFTAGVSVSLKVSVDLGIFTIHIRLSFHTTISYQFLIGSPSIAQWKPQAALPHSPANLHGHVTGVLEPLTDEEKNVLIVQMDWNAVFPDDQAEYIDLFYFTQFSAADDSSDALQQKAVAIGMLFAPNSDGANRNESLTSLNEIRNRLLSFEQIAVISFCWVLNAANSKTDQSTSLDQLLAKSVTQVKLANILFTINHSNQLSPFSYQQIVALIKNLFIFNIKDKTDIDENADNNNTKEKPQLNLSLFPMIPDLYFTPQNQDEILFSSTHPVGDDYLEQVKALINRFAMGQQGTGKIATQMEAESLTTLLFRDYFQLLIKTLVQSALDALQVYKFTIPATIGEDKEAPTLYRITKLFTTDDVSAADVIAIAVSNQNNTALLNPGARLRVSGIQYSIEKNDTLAGILKNCGLHTAGENISDDLIEQLIELNGDKEIFITPRSITIDNTRHDLEDNDTINTIVKRLELDKPQTYALINSIKDQADILQVFKQFSMPTIEHTIKEKDGLLTITNQYQVDMNELAIENQDNEAILQVSKKIIIENIRSLNVGELISYLYQDGALGHAAGTASRFFMYGLRLPNAGIPDTTSAVYGLSGQQFEFDFEEVEETKVLIYDRVTLSKVSATTDTEEDDNATDPLPWVAFNGQTLDPDTHAPAKLEHHFLPAEISIAKNYQQARFSPIIEQGPVSIKLYNDQLKTYTLGNPIFWQTETTIADSQPPVYPSIWQFPPGLRSIRHLSPSLQMVVGTQPQKNTKMQKDIIPEDKYNWCALLPISIRKASHDSEHNTISNNTYEVYGTDAAGIELLTELVSQTNVIDSTQILFPSNPDNNEANALQSYDDTGLTLLINTNLSTETNPDTLTASAENDTPGIPSTSPHDMVIRLWKASLVRTGGYYLYLRNQEGKGLPDNLFTSEQTTDIYLLINYKKTDQISSCMNSVTLRQSIDSEHSVLFAEWTVPLDEQGNIENSDQLVKEDKIARIPAILPGHVGFKLVRTNPNKLYGITEHNQIPSKPYTYQLETQYNLLDFEVVDSDSFKNIGEGLAVGAEKDHHGENLNEPATNDVASTDLISPWKYKRAFPLANVIKNKPANKTAYLGLNQTIEMGFSWRDNYGNRLKPSDPEEALNLEINIKYFDYLIPLSQWPHIDINYEFMANGPHGDNFIINFLFHAASEYSISSDATQIDDIKAEIKALKDKVQADLEIYEKSLDQIRQDDVRLSYAVSMTPELEGGYPQTDKRALMKSGMLNHITNIIGKTHQFITDLHQYQEQIQIAIPATKPRIDDIAYNWTEHVADTNKNDIFPLDVEFSINRSEQLIDPAFKDVAQVKCVKTAIKPKSENLPILTIDNQEKYSTFIEELDLEKLPEMIAEKLPDQSSKILIIEKGQEWKILIEGQTYFVKAEKNRLNVYRSGIGLSLLADNFEKLYPGMKVSSAYTKGKQQQEVWIVRFKSENNIAGIGFNIHHEQSLFYAPQPLSTHLASLNQVPIYPHTDYGIEPPPAPLAMKNFSMIDPETWAIDYLETLETTLRPEFSIAITMFDNLINKDADRGFLYTILEAKRIVADAIALQTIPILEDNNMKTEGLGVAREKLKQQLLINLIDGYNTNAVVQYNVDVVSNYPDTDNPIAQIAPNLFGQPYVTHEDKSLNVSSETQDSPNYSLSTGKVALKGNDKNYEAPAQSYLTFIFNTQTERYHSEIPLVIDYKVNHLEFDIRAIDDIVDPLDPESICNYSVSKWLSFVKPFDTQSRDIATTHIPVPIRQYPRLPNWNSQQFMAKDQSQDIIDIMSAKQIDYTFSYSLAQFTAQDTIHFEILFNSHKAEEDRLVSISKTTDELDRILQYSLAQFNEAKDSILKDLRVLLPQVNIDMEPDIINDLTGLLSSYDHLTNQVATAWRNRFDPDILSQLGDSSLNVIAAKFNLDEDEDKESDKQGPGRFRVMMTKWSVSSNNQDITFIAVPTVLVDGYQFEAYGYEKGSQQAQAITSDNRYGPWVKVFFHYYKINSQNEKVYLSFDEGKKLLNRTVRFNGLDVLLVQNAWPGLNVVRNAKLSEVKQTSEEFIYTTPMKRFANPVTPMLDVSGPLDIASLREDRSAELSEYLSSLVKNLLEASETVQKASEQIFQPTTLKIVTSYSFSSNSDVGVISQPCFLIPPTLFDKADAAGDGTSIKLLAEGIVEWFNNNRPVQTEGKLFFDITFYSLMADNDLPVLRLRQLFIDVDRITTLKQYAG